MNVENFYATIILILDAPNNSDKRKKFVRFFTRIEIFEFFFPPHLFKFHRKINNIESIFNQFDHNRNRFEMFCDSREKIYVVFANLLANYDRNDQLDVETRQK